LLEGGRVYYRFLKGEAVRILEKVGFRMEAPLHGVAGH